MNAVGSNLGSMFITLKPFDQRRGPGLSADEIAATLRARIEKEVLEAKVGVFGAPAVDGLGNAGGFKLMVETIGDINYPQLQGQADNLAEKGNQIPGIMGMADGFRASTPQLFVDVDRVECKTLGVALSDLFATLQVYLGGFYVNDFNRFGRTWQVNVQADAPFRINSETVKQLKVRSSTGEVIPLGTLAKVRDTVGPLVVTRYNMYPAATVTGGSLPGVSSGYVLHRGGSGRQRTAALDDLRVDGACLFAKTFQQGRVVPRPAAEPVQRVCARRNLVFFVLCGLYESWSLPMAVILVVPMCLSSALVGVAMAKMDVNIFVQVGFVVLVGLASKNAILIVELCATGKRKAPALRRRGRSSPRAIAADYHDIVRVHPRRIAARRVAWCRCRNATHTGNGRVLGHAGRHDLRHLSNTRVFLCRPKNYRPTPRGKAGTSSSEQLRERRQSVPV